MKKILFLSLIIILFTLSEKVFACSCEWFGPFFKVAKGTDLVVYVKIKNFGAFSGNIPMYMEAEVIERLKGNDTRKNIKIWGDTGMLCRPYLSRFQSDSTWVLSLFKSYSQGYFRHPDETDQDYNISGCGEYWVKVKKDTVIGYIEPENYIDPAKKMKLESFLTSAKQVFTSVETEIPNTFELGQNYPNPFNPETDISYQISAFSHVILKVYDLLGREVAVLINQYQNAGKHEVKFNPQNLSGGVYIYQLSTGNYVARKKMVYLK